MSDLIDRQAAIDALKEKVFSNLTDEFYGAMQVLDELPSAQRTGEWIHDGSNWTNRWICSKCGYKWFFDKPNYCPNCGADMRGAQE